LPWFQSTTYIDIKASQPMSWCGHGTGECARAWATQALRGVIPYHRTHKAVWVLFKLLQSFLLAAGPLDKLRSLSNTNILEDAVELVGRRRSFANVEFKRFSPGMSGLVAVVGSLIFRGRLGSVSGGLLEQVCDADRGGERGFVEEGYHVKGFVLDLLATNCKNPSWAATMRNILLIHGLIGLMFIVKVEKH